MTPSALRSRAWRRVTHGFYTPPIGAELTTTQRILDATPLLGSDAAIGGWAAAYVHGVDWLDGFDPFTMKPWPIDCPSSGLKRLNTPGVRYRHTELADSDVCRRYDISVTTPLRTAFDGARWARNLEEAVVFLDAMYAFGRPPAARLPDYVGRHPGLAGVRRAAMAAGLTEPGVRSPWESRLRICYRLQARLPAPLINVPIFGPAGRLLGVADLFDPEAGFVAEFDGDHHRERAQHRSDNRREERFESANLTVVRSTVSTSGSIEQRSSNGSSTEKASLFGPCGRTNSEQIAGPYASSTRSSESAAGARLRPGRLRPGPRRSAW